MFESDCHETDSEERDGSQTSVNLLSLLDQSVCGTEVDMSAAGASKPGNMQVAAMQIGYLDLSYFEEVDRARTKAMKSEAAMASEAFQQLRRPSP